MPEVRSPDAVAAYAALRTALAVFEAPPEKLSAAQLAEVGAKVGRELAIGDAVLASDMAGVVTVGDAEVVAAMAELQSRYASEADFLRELASRGLDRQGLKQALQRELTVAAVLAKVAAMAPEVGEAEVRDYFDSHRERFAYPETREARHILITINDAYPENRREAAYGRIARIAHDVGDSPERFIEAAARHSECPTAMQQGRLGRGRPGRLYPELDVALFAMGEGEIGGPIETEIGFHLLYCESIHPAGEASFEQAAAKIRERLQQSRVRQCQKAWLAALEVPTVF